MRHLARLAACAPPGALLIGLLFLTDAARGALFAATATDLTLLTEQNPPHNYQHPETGRLTGTGTRVVQELMQLTGIAHTITLLPWQRAFQKTLSAPDHCLFSMNRTAAREDRFAWVGPLITGKWQFYSRQQDHLTLESVEDAHDLVVVGLRGSANLASYRATGGKRIIAVDEDAMAADLLMHGRARLWLTGKRDAHHVMERDPRVKARLALTFRDVRLSLGCHPDTDPTLMDRMRTALPRARRAARQDQ
ncbi:substrate-binding periplasmic protein [Yunchengibacter salinarum]|uniref:substrate-binding periplasmic protein n=1 Tax=Yunchengibacter salinarum TaxID=3133399 RepID=UPI0035B60B94